MSHLYWLEQAKSHEKKDVGKYVSVVLLWNLWKSGKFMVLSSFSSSHPRDMLQLYLNGHTA